MYRLHLLPASRSIIYNIYDVHPDIQRLKCIVTFQHRGTHNLLFQVFPVTDSMTIESHGNTSLLQQKGDKISFLSWVPFPPYESGIEFTMLFPSRQVSYKVYESAETHAKSVFDQISKLMNTE